MSYEKIKTIKIKDGKVYLNSKANNDTSPFRTWECKSLSDFLQKNGEGELQIEIMKEYENGTFQSQGNNKWTRSLRALRQMDEYKAFNWRLSDYADACPINAARKTEAYKQLLLKALNTKPESGNFILKRDHDHQTIYFKRGTKFSFHKTEAKIFKYIEDVKALINRFESPEKYQIETL